MILPQSSYFAISPKTCATFIYCVSDSSLLVPMSERKKTKILKPEQYSEALGDLIEREYFPDLSQLRSSGIVSHKKRNTDIIDLTETSIEEFHSKTLSTDEAAFRTSQSLDRRRHANKWTKIATPGESSQLALRLVPPARVPNHASSKPVVRRENTRLNTTNTSESLLMMESRFQATVTAKSVIQQSVRRADLMVEQGRFDPEDNHYTIPPVDPREEVAIKLEQDILRVGLRRKRS